MKGAVARLYGCWNEAAGIAERLTAVIGPDGIIRYAPHNPPLEARDYKEAVAAPG